MFELKEFLVQFRDGLLQLGQLSGHGIHGFLGCFPPHFFFKLQEFTHAGIGKELGIFRVGTGDFEDKDRGLRLLLNPEIRHDSLQIRVRTFHRRGGTVLDRLTLHQGNLGSKIVAEFLRVDRRLGGHDPWAHHHSARAHIQGLAQEVSHPLH